MTCQPDLSAVALSAAGRSDTSDWAQLHSKMSTNPPAGAGIQVDGYFPDDSTTNTTYGWNHDSQFVIRLPERWNGQLVVTGAPGVRKQYANDYIISDWVLSQGYAYASTDKGNSGTSFFNNGARSAPGQAVREWHDRVSELTVAAQQVVQQRYGRTPDRTWMTGISNGGYLTRWQLENRPELYDGGVDWEGSLFQAEAPNLLTYLPTALREYPQAAGRPGRPPAHVRRRLRARQRVAVARPLRRLLGPHPALLPRGLRPRLRRRHRRRHAVLPDRHRPRHPDGLRRAVRLREPPAVGEGRARHRQGHGEHRQADAHAARRPSTPSCRSGPTATSTPRSSGRSARARCTGTT